MTILLENVSVQKATLAMGVPSYVRRERLAMVAARSANAEKIVTAIRLTANASASQAILAIDARAVAPRDDSDQNVVNYVIVLTEQYVTNEMVHAFAHQDSLARNVTRHVHLEDMEKIVKMCVHVKMVVRVIAYQVIANARQASQG